MPRHCWSSAVAGGVIGRAAGLVLAALVLGGCPNPPPSQFPNGAAALDRMKATYACANGVQGEGKIDHFGPRGRVRGSVLIFAVNPARVRIDVLSPLNSMLFTLTSNGETFEMLDFEKKLMLHGPASPCNLARMTQVEIPGHVLVWLLRGEAPLLKHEPDAPTLKWDEDHYHVTIPSTRDAVQEIDLEIYEADWNLPWQKQRLRVTEVQTIQRGVVLYNAELDDHELAHTMPARVDPDGLAPPIPPSGDKCDVEIPRAIHLTVPHSGDDVVFQYQKVGFNPPIPAGAFSQDKIDGVRRQYTTCR